MIMAGVCRNLPDRQYPTTLIPPEIPVYAMNDDHKSERLELDFRLELYLLSLADDIRNIVFEDCWWIDIWKIISSENCEQTGFATSSISNDNQLSSYSFWLHLFIINFYYDLEMGFGIVFIGSYSGGDLQTRSHWRAESRELSVDVILIIISHWLIVCFVGWSRSRSDTVDSSELLRPHPTLFHNRHSLYSKQD